MSGKLTSSVWLVVLAAILAIFTGRAAAQTPASATSRQGSASTEGGERVLLDFEAPSQMQLVSATEEGALTLSRSDEWAASGKYSLKVAAKTGARYGGFDLTDPALLAGWQDYDYMLFDVSTPDTFRMMLTPELWDTASNSYGTRATYNLLPETRLPRVHKGKQTLTIDLRLARRNAKEGLAFAELKPEDKINRAQLTKVRYIMELAGLKQPYVLYIDNIRLVKAGAMELPFKLSLPEGAVGYQFGKGNAMEGFTLVSDKDAFGGDKPYGFTKAEGVQPFDKDWPDPLTGRFVGPKYSPEFFVLPPEAAWEFKAKVKDGKYLVWVAAGYLPFASLDVAADINGHSLFQQAMGPTDFWTERGLYRFLKTQYSEKPNAVWINYIDKMYPSCVVEVEAKDGTITVHGKNAFLSAMIILPADQKEVMDKLVAQIRRERIKFFYKDLYLDRQDNQPCATTDSDFVLFTARGVMPWTGFAKEQTQKITALAAPGEVVYLPAAIRPFKDVPGVKLAMSDLKSDKDAKLSVEQEQVLLKQYLSDGIAIHGWGMLPVESVDLEKGLTRGLYIRMKVPANAAAGLYKAALTASAEGVTREIPIELTVVPVKLSDDIPLSIGHFYEPPLEGQRCMLEKAPASEQNRVLAEQMRLFHENGFNSITIPTPKVMKIEPGHMTLDFTATEKVAKAAKAAGLFANTKQRAMVGTLPLGRAIGGTMPGSPTRGENIGGELKLPGFEETFLNGFRQIVEWGRKNDVPLVEWLVDEPRENPNPWNRNLADTIAYCQLAGKVDGAVRMVTPMGDSGAGKDYTVLLDHLEIVDTHANKTSEKMMTRAMKDEKPELWIYNTGTDRYSNGFYIWRIGAGAKHEWHFSQYVLNSAAPKYFGRDVHNPFLLYEYDPYSVSAPLTYPGAVLLQEGFFTMHDGAMDYRYLYALDQAIAKAEKANQKPETVAQAKAFVEELKKSISPIPTVEGMTSEADLAGLGGGIVEGYSKPLDEWRAKVAELIVKLESAGN